MFGHVVTYCNTQSSSGTGARGLPRRCQDGDVIPRQRAPRCVALGWESSGVRGCPGAASEDCEKPLAKVSQGFFVIRDASLAIRPDSPPFTPFSQREPPPAGHRRPAPSRGRERRQHDPQRRQRRTRRHCGSGSSKHPHRTYDARPSLRSGATATRPMRRRRGNPAPQEDPRPDSAPRGPRARIAPADRRRAPGDAPDP